MGLTDDLWARAESILSQLATEDETQAITLGEKLVKSLRENGQTSRAVQVGLKLAEAVAGRDFVQASARSFANQIVHSALGGGFELALDVADKCAISLGVPCYGYLAVFAECNYQGDLIGPAQLLQRLKSSSDSQDHQAFAFRIVARAQTHCPNISTLLQFLSDEHSPARISSTLETWRQRWTDCHDSVSNEDMAAIEAKFPDIDLPE